MVNGAPPSMGVTSRLVIRWLHVTVSLARSTMRTLLSSLAVLTASVAYVAWQALAGGTARAGNAVPATTQPPTAAPTWALAQPTAVPAQPTAVPAQPTAVPAQPTAVPTRVPASPTAATTGKGALHDGTWTSDAIQTNWGPIQVEMVVENGRITDVASIQYPQSRSRSLQISRYALPIYAEQVVSMQNARVNSVSGATQTARGFQQAVQAAIQKAS